MSQDTTTLIVTTEAFLHQANRYFYAAVAALLIVMMLWGFHHFYFEGLAYPGRELAPPIRTLVIFHAIAMGGWMLILMTQSLLIVNGKHRVHRMLGITAAVLAAAIVLLGWWLAVASLRMYPLDMVIWGLNPRQFLAVPVIGMLLFGGLVTAGVFCRGRPQVHPNLMLLATLSAIAAAISRIDTISALYKGTYWETWFGPFFGMLVIALFFLAIKYLVTKALDRSFAIGWVGLVLACAMIMVLARTSVWESFAAYLLS